MEAQSGMNSKRSTLPSTDRRTGHAASRTAGLTIVELLITLVIGVMILGLALSLTMSNRRLYQVDRSRTETNQNLRVTLDMIGADARIAGELMTDPALKLLAIEVFGGSELILRRKQLSGTLPVCLEDGDTFGPGDGLLLPISRSAAGEPKMPSFCDWIDVDGNGMPDYVEPYAELLASQGGVAHGYIYQPNRFEPISITGIEAAGNPMGGRILTLAEPLINTYDAASAALVFISERHYRVNDGVLELIIDADIDNPLLLASRIDDFSVSVTTAAGNATEFNAAAGSKWQEATEIHAQLTAHGSGRESSGSRSLASSFFPRNVLSRGGDN